MRYKFRAKCIDESVYKGHWLYGFGIHNWDDDGIEKAEIHSTIGVYEVDPKTVGQYIGVHDGEGENEIFEGDNIRIEHEGETITGNVQHCGGGFILASDDFEDGFAWISDLTENDGRYFWIPNSEVIGNRWSNPDLLGEVRE